jgi:hypothetical protein
VTPGRASREGGRAKGLGAATLALASAALSFHAACGGRSSIFLSDEAPSNEGGRAGEAGAASEAGAGGSAGESGLSGEAGLGGSSGQAAGQGGVAGENAGGASGSSGAGMAGTSGAGAGGVAGTGSMAGTGGLAGMGGVSGAGGGTGVGGAPNDVFCGACVSATGGGHCADDLTSCHESFACSALDACLRGSGCMARPLDELALCAITSCGPLLFNPQALVLWNTYALCALCSTSCYATCLPLSTVLCQFDDPALGPLSAPEAARPLSCVAP